MHAHSTVTLSLLFSNIDVDGQSSGQGTQVLYVLACENHTWVGGNIALLYEPGLKSDGKRGTCDIGEYRDQAMLHNVDPTSS